ncbi:5729_t:CDS:10, partial [Cetraspora pellucida]
MKNHTFEPTSFNFAIQSSPFVELGIDLNLVRSRSFQSQDLRRLEKNIAGYALTQLADAEGQLSNPAVDFNYGQIQRFKSNSAIEFESDFNFMSSHSSNPIIEPEGVLNLTLNQSFSNPPVNDFIVTPGPSSSSNDISSDDESQENLLQLYVGLPFNTWEEVDSFVESYGKSKAMSVPIHVHIRPKKLSTLLSSGTTQITCISFDDKHNHELNPIISQTAPWFCKLSKEMIGDIKFYICSTEGLGAKMQYNLLKTKYPDKYIDRKDLYNAIQRFRIPS